MNKRTRFRVGFVSVVGCVLAFGLSAAAKPAEKAEVQGQQAAQQWLKLVDETKYAESWTESASYFRGVVSKAQWVTTIQGVRGPLGKVLKRKLMKATFATELPGAPDGEYVVVKYKTSFSEKKDAVETVTPMLDKDGLWRVSGYFIK